MIDNPEYYIPAEIPRDGFDRPLVIPPGGKSRVPYTRCTTFVGCLEDTYNLSQWSQRMVARGLSQRPDLLLRVSSLGPEPDDDGAAKAWKSQLNGVCTAAREAAAASSAATIGTSLHALTERLDRGLDLGVVPQAYQPHLKAYEHATREMAMLHIEQFSVHDGLKIGGTSDRVVEIDGQAYIGDIKTGSVDYGVGKMAMQLAVYARCVTYDPATNERRPYARPVSTDKGVIIALSAKTGACRLIWLDLAAGWEAVQLAGAVRAWRARRNLIVDKGEDYIWSLDRQGDALAESLTAQTDAVEAALRSAIREAGDHAELVALWQAANPMGRWTAEHTALAAARKAELAGAVAA